MKLPSGWNVGLSFGNAAHAVEALKEYALLYDPVPLRVVDSRDNVVFAEDRLTYLSTRREWAEHGRKGYVYAREEVTRKYGFTASDRPTPAIVAGWSNTTQEENSMSDTTTQPLHIPRNDLINALEARLAEEQQKRQDAEDKKAAARKGALDAVETLTADQVANIIDHYVTGGCGGSDAIVKWVEDVTENDKFVSKEAKVTATENSIEKYVRVLNLANDTDIEIAPSDPLYPLL